MDPTLPVEERVESLLSVMTPEDKMELIREGWGILVFLIYMYHLLRKLRLYMVFRMVVELLSFPKLWQWEQPGIRS